MILLILSVTWLIFMLYLSHQDGAHTGRMSRDLAEKLSFLDGDIGNLNGKLRRDAHVILYLVLTLLLGSTLLFGGLPLYGLFAVVLLAWADEATKPWIKGRHFSWFDVGLNLIGTGAGIVVLAVAQALI